MTGAPLRIALISEHASPLASLGSVDAGGQNTYVASIAKALAMQGHQVDVFTRRDDRDMPTVVDMRPGCRVIHVDAGPPSFVAKERMLELMPAFASRMAALMRHSVGYDVVHANFFMSGWVGLRLQDEFDVPLVTTFHALGLVRREHQPDDAFPASRIGIERVLMQRSDAVIAECPQDRLDMVRLYGADTDRLHTVACGIDREELAPVGRETARRHLGLHGDAFTVLQLGRMVPRKGIDNVIRALALLDAPARLLVVGGDADKGGSTAAEAKRLRRLALECGVRSRVDFIGQRSRADLRWWYSAADVFVSTPWYEPFGITPLEAMACALPVVGADVGGIKYSVVDGVTGLLVPPRDPRALASSLAYLGAHPEVARAMGLAGLRRVRTEFTWERIAAQLLDVYRAVLARGRTRRSRSLRLVAVGSTSPSSTGVMACLH